MYMINRSHKIRQLKIFFFYLKLKLAFTYTILKWPCLESEIEISILPEKRIYANV